MQSKNCDENQTISGQKFSDSKNEKKHKNSKKNFFTSTQLSQPNDSPLSRSSKKRFRNLNHDKILGSSSSIFKSFEYKNEKKFSKINKKDDIEISEEEEDDDRIVYLDNTDLELDDEFEADFSFIKKQKINSNTSIEEIL